MGIAATIDTKKLFARLAKMLRPVIGLGITSVAEKARVERLRAACQDGVDVVTLRVEACDQAIQMPVYKARISQIINECIDDWSTEIYDEPLSLESKLEEPPRIYV